MNEFTLYFTLGWEHVLDLEGYDHALFIIALALTFQLKEWKGLLGLVTFFTIGHTISLYAASKGWLPMSQEVVEVLIPLSICLSAIFAALRALKPSKPFLRKGVLWFITLLFGVIHGFGFGRYYNVINDEGGFSPLLSFALGIEAAQVLIVLVVLLVLYFLYERLRFKKQHVILTGAVIIALISAVMTGVRYFEYF